MNQAMFSSCVLYFVIFLLSFVCQAKTKVVAIGNLAFSQTLLNVGRGESMISAADFNSDSHQDILVSNYSDNNIVIYFGDGKGNLIEARSYSAGENPTDMSVADLNDDGYADVLIANHETSYLTLLNGDGQGGFKNSAQSPLKLPVKPHPHVVKLKDLDGDNKADLIVDNRTHNGLLVLKGLGDSKFNTTEQLINVGGDPYLGFAIGDINTDGKLDIVTPNQRDIGVLLNTSAKQFSYSLNKISPLEAPFAVELADMTADGKIDLLVASQGSMVTMIPGDGQGYFLTDRKTTIATSAGAKQIATGDINGDGIKDALVTHWSGDILVILGSKTSLETMSFKNINIPNPWGLVVVDLNEDGKSDFIIAGGDGTLAAVYISQGN
jgi:hypothetical protein